MCIACEMSFWNMIDALPPEAPRADPCASTAARFACDAPADEPPPAAPAG